MTHYSTSSQGPAATGSIQPAVSLLQWEGTSTLAFYFKEDAVLFVTEGQLRSRYGDQQHLINKHGFVVFKKGSLLECEPVVPHSNSLLFVVRHELALQFAAMMPRADSKDVSMEQVVWGKADRSLVEFCHTIGARLYEHPLLPGALSAIKILELMFHLSGVCPAIASLLTDCRDRYIRDIPTVMEEKLMDDVPLPQLARLVGRSLSSFRRDFFSIYNMAPSKWIRQKKLERARVLLSNTNMTITEICYTMGFQSNAHFSRIFKSCFGYPPSDRRRPVLPS